MTITDQDKQAIIARLREIEKSYIAILAINPDYDLIQALLDKVRAQIKELSNG